MSIATVVTRGFGTFGTVNDLPTLGYASAAICLGPLRIAACEAVQSIGATICEPSRSINPQSAVELSHFGSRAMEVDIR